MIPEEIKISQTQKMKIYRMPGKSISSDGNWVSFIGEDKENPDLEAIYINNDNGELVQMQGFLHRLMELGSLVMDRKDLTEDDHTLGRLSTYLVMLINNNNLDFNVESMPEE